MSFLSEIPADLKRDILEISESHDGAIETFERLYNFLTSGPTKKRKLQATSTNESDGEDYYQLDSIEPATIIFQLQNLSFQSPLRKKLNLTLSISPITQKPVLTIGKRNEDKPDLLIDELTNDNVIFSTFLPVPEKANLLYLVLFYKKNFSSAFQNEPIVLTLNQEQVKKQLVDEKVIKEADDFKVYIQRQATISGFTISNSFTNSFNSFYVEAHRGTKEGLLYFLPNHILFGFKKPILLFDSKDVESISYSSITRVTFNVTLTLKTGEKYEFSMIDQSDFGNIDGYIKNREVMDNSMSEEYKAKPQTKSQDTGGALAEASQQLGEEVIGDENTGLDEQNSDSDDEENDANFQQNAEIDDTSDVSDDEEVISEAEEDEDEDEDDDEEDEEEDDHSIDLGSDE